MTQEKKEAVAVGKGSDTPQPTQTPKTLTSSEKEETHTARKAEEEAATKAEAERKAKKEAPYVAIAQRYANYYPDCSEFHITADRMVFLAGDKAEAQRHQRSLGKGELHTIKVR